MTRDTIRPGATRVDVYNEGLLVFLCDESHLPLIEASGADLETGYAAIDADIDKPIRKLAKDAILVTYELLQDDPIVAEVVVGAPLTKAELKMGRWLKPQLAHIKLPSGTLRIDTANTLPGEDQDPDEEPGRVAVPPGDYLLSLYRLDWDRVEADGLLNADHEWDGPQEIILLTPQAEARQAKGLKPLLRFPRPESAAWAGKYEIIDGVFHGKVLATGERSLCLINLDRPAAEQLKLAAGVGVRLALGELDLGDVVLEAVYIGEADPLWLKTGWARKLRGERTEFGVAYRPLDNPDQDRLIVLDRVVHSKSLAPTGKWVPARLTLLNETFAIPATSATTVSDDDGPSDPDEIAELDAMFDDE